MVLTALVLSGCFGGTEEPEAVPVVPAPTIKEAERPTFTVDIDEEDAFEKALEAIPADEVPQFVEVIDEGNADEIVAAEPGEKQLLENEEDKAQRAESEARAAAREASQDGADNKGLDFRTYSEELMAQVKGVRPAILYFTADDCETCATWEEGLRSEAAAFADRNALIMMADFETYTDLAKEMRVTEPGWAMMMTGVGEFMGPRPSSRLTKDDLLFIFK